MITASLLFYQLLFHFIGDYWTQSHWMAVNKVKRHWPAAAHAITYSVPFIFICPSVLSFLTILVTHFLIDRYSLAKRLVWIKNMILGNWILNDITNKNDEVAWDDLDDEYSWKNCKDNAGYPKSVPVWLAVPLTVVADNVLHVAINFLAISHL